MQPDAWQARRHADRLDSFAGKAAPGWQEHAEQIDDVIGDINAMGTQLCRLQTIRNEVSPWQQQAIDQVALDLRLMANNAQNASHFVNTKQDELWVGTYQAYLNNLDHEAAILTRSLGHAVEYPKVSKEYRELRPKVAARPTS